MLRRILLTALLAGTAAGLFAAGVQHLKLLPLIAAAEIYERAGAAPGTAAGQGAHQHDHAHPAPVATEAAEWEPAPGLERSLYTILADILAGIGFALMLTGAAALASQRGHPINPQRGLLWGAAGFAAFSLAPALGLPPELPGMMAASLAARQQWWVMTAIATAAGLGLIAFARPVAVRLAGIALLVVPHLIGAPATPHHAGGVPAELAAQFATASLATAAAFWLVLGSLSFWLYRRLE